MADPNSDWLGKLEARLDRLSRIVGFTCSVVAALVVCLMGLGLGLPRYSAIIGGIAAFWIVLVWLSTKLKGL